MSKTNDILSQRMRRIERTLDRVAHILEDEALLRIKIHKEQAAVMGNMRSNDKTENVVAMLALVRHHCELGWFSAGKQGLAQMLLDWDKMNHDPVAWFAGPNVNANEVNGFAGDPAAEAWNERHAKDTPAAIKEELVNHTYEDASGIRTCKVQRYAYCVCAAYPGKHAYRALRAHPTFRALNSEAEAMEIAFTGNGVYAFRCEALAESKTWELISPVRKEVEEDEELEH